MYAAFRKPLNLHSTGWPAASRSGRQIARLIHVIDVPEVTSMEIDGTRDRFPIRRVFCLGRNYRAHAIESGDNPDVNPPFFFIKPRDAVVAASDGFPTRK